MTGPLVYSPSPADPALAAGTVTVDLSALQQNWRKLARLAGPAECAVTVKGDAYGLGIEPCATALWQAGARTFFVALPHEGATLRQILPQATIYILSGLFAGAARHYTDHNLRPCLNSLEEVTEWRRHAAELGKSLSAALHIESGINRLGLTAANVETLAASPDLLDGIETAMVLSHLASGDDPDNPSNARQLTRFNALRAKLPPALASLANSPGSFLGHDFALDMIRPGIALYGGNPFAAGQNPMATVARLTAPVLQVRDVPAGETVGYSATWRAECPSRIAVIGLGYRDGYLRSLSSPARDGPAEVAIAGKRCPVIGRISMDLVTIDVTALPADSVVRGTEVEVFGDTVTADEVAAWAGTIPYEIFTGLGSRYARVYSPTETT